MIHICPHCGVPEGFHHPSCINEKLKELKDVYERLDKIENEMSEKVEKEKYFVAENTALKKAGHNLAQAALYVAKEYDGIHRLLLAVSEWAKTVANEGGREQEYKN